jgi:hypothetical protein
MISTKPPKCKHCKQRTPSEFVKIHPECFPLWWESYTAKQKAKRAKADRADTKTRKEAIKTHAEWKADAQKAVNDFVRLRDADLPCISCGRFHDGAWHAGHFRSRGAAPQLALDPRNVHRQCAPCNLYLHGNQIAYRAGLVARYGSDYVDAIESENEPLKLTIDELRQIKTIYRAKTRALRKEQA